LAQNDINGVIEASRHKKERARGNNDTFFHGKKSTGLGHTPLEVQKVSEKGNSIIDLREF
jgi:hypothetical protein